MLEAGQEEQYIGISKGDFYKIPSIIVIMGGGGPKRTCKLSSNALRSVAVIIGKDTKTMCHFGVCSCYPVCYILPKVN